MLSSVTQVTKIIRNSNRYFWSGCDSSLLWSMSKRFPWSLYDVKIKCGSLSESVSEDWVICWTDKSYKKGKKTQFLLWCQGSFTLNVSPIGASPHQPLPSHHLQRKELPNWWLLSRPSQLWLQYLNTVLISWIQWKCNTIVLCFWWDISFSGLIISGGYGLAPTSIETFPFDANCYIPPFNQCNLSLRRFK